MHSRVLVDDDFYEVQKQCAGMRIRRPETPTTDGAGSGSVTALFSELFSSSEPAM